MTVARPWRDHYAVLGVEPSASAQQITSAYRAQVRLLHPDSRPARSAEAGSVERLVDVIAAYEVLHDPGLRAAYDAERGGGRLHSGADEAAGRAAAVVRVAVRVVPATGNAPAATVAVRLGGKSGWPSDPAVWVGPVRVEPCARSTPLSLWEWMNRLWEVDPWL
ncbi:J domain-containing protein [Kitasatospora cathayae]|uniref:J domain-containing protein n=1 Tax=Kitasatospora cathayae TaxID=3004092 RepID=A0ABY7PVU1_9ACTN|nr:J domain-containing protein [Kitasatospora sp. HUAS 3-15]WBP84550.1 J domain-containing protein [Kitasatospora sp. HUAS 3-15]